MPQCSLEDSSPNDPFNSEKARSVAADKGCTTAELAATTTISL